jgi:hypothetical protein
MLLLYWYHFYDVLFFSCFFHCVWPFLLFNTIPGIVFVVCIDSCKQHNTKYTTQHFQDVACTVWFCWYWSFCASPCLWYHSVPAVRAKSESLWVTQQLADVIQNLCLIAGNVTTCCLSSVLFYWTGVFLIHVLHCPYHFHMTGNNVFTLSISY